MNKRYPANKVERIKYLIDMHNEIYPSISVVKETLLSGTPIEKLCEDRNSGIKGPYQRVRDNFEKRIGIIEKSKELELKFSGTKEEHINGATRDSREGKGRYDLISPLFLKRLAKVLEKGGKNHGDNNWMNGIKYSRLIDSSLRHISQFNEGLRDEDHIAQAVANLMFLLHFEEAGRTDCNDLKK